jgi:predicted RNase H-like nuclease
MITKKTIELGEYIVNITYDNETGSISVEVLDELHDLIESLDITNAEDLKKNDDDDNDAIIDLNIGLN